MFYVHVMRREEKIVTERSVAEEAEADRDLMLDDLRRWYGGIS